MSINLQKMEQKFNALLDDPNFVAEFDQWLEARNVKPALQQTPCTTLLEFLEQMLNEVSQYDSDGYLSAEMAIEDIKKGDAISYVIQMIKDCQPIA